MASRYFQPGAERSAGVHALFSRIARRYDRINDVQSLGLQRGWKRRLVRLAAPQPGQTVLDLCCGTGDIAFRLSRPGLRVVGADFNLAMLGVARTRQEGATARRISARSNATPPGGRDVRFVAADGMRLPFVDGAFDLVTISYGLRNLPDIRAGLRELHRVLRPGGRLLVLDFGKPANRFWRAIYFAYLRGLVPLFGRVFCGDADAYGYILESLRAYPSAPELAAQMAEAGWIDLRVHAILGGIMAIHEGRRA